MIHSGIPDSQQEKKEPIIQRITPLPSVMIDFMAMTICDLIPPSLPTRITSMPELVYFIQKTTFQAGINCRTALVALIYLNRAKQSLPKRAVGGYDTCHRMFLASILLASKFLCTDTVTTNISQIPTTWSHYYSFHHRYSFGSGPLTNRKLSDMCDGLYPLAEINQLERAFLKLIRYQCWVNDKEVNNFVLKHRVDFSL